VPGFLSSRLNWLPPPLTRKRVLPSLWFQRGYTLARGRGEEPIWTKGQTLWYSRYSIIPLRFPPSMYVFLLSVYQVYFLVQCTIVHVYTRLYTLAGGVGWGGIRIIQKHNSLVFLFFIIPWDHPFSFDVPACHKPNL
jgi:hypothetical protein